MAGKCAILKIEVEFLKYMFKWHQGRICGQAWNKPTLTLNFKNKKL